MQRLSLKSNSFGQDICKLDDGEVTCDIKLLLKVSPTLKDSLEHSIISGHYRLQGVTKEIFHILINLLIYGKCLDDLSDEELKKVTPVISNFEIEELSGGNIILLERHNRGIENRLRQKLMNGEQLTEVDRLDYAFDIFGQNHYDFYPLDETIQGIIVKNSDVFVGLQCKSFQQFQSNFKAIEGGLLNNLNWNNLVVAGGSVLAALRGERGYSGDLDFFIYGLDEDQARTKIEEIVTTVTDNYVVKFATFDLGQWENAGLKKRPFIEMRTKYTLTLWFNKVYVPLQVVFRLSSCPEEVILGFDIDCVKVLYDGNKVLITDQAALSLIYGYNLADGNRQIFRTGTYEKRLQKYFERGFNVRVPGYSFNKLKSTFFSEKATSGLGVLIKRLYSAAMGAKINKKDEEQNEEEGYTLATSILTYGGGGGGSLNPLDKLLYAADMTKNLVYILLLADQIIQDRYAIFSTVDAKEMMINELTARRVWNLQSAIDIVNSVDISETIQFSDTFQMYKRSLPEMQDWYGDVLNR